MLWQLKHGKNELRLRELARSTGQSLPDAIRDKPELCSGLEFYWIAFQEMATDRHIGMSEGPIPWSTIDRWSRRHGVTGLDFERLVYIIKEMDGAYLEYRSTENEKLAAKATKKPTGMKQPKGAIRSRKGRF